MMRRIRDTTRALPRRALMRGVTAGSIAAYLGGAASGPANAAEEATFPAHRRLARLGPIWEPWRWGVMIHGDLSEYAEGSVLEHGRLREVQDRLWRCAASPKRLAGLSPPHLVDTSPGPDMA